MSNRITDYFNVLIFHVRRKQVLELKAGVMEMRFYGAFAASGACGDVFDRESFNVV